MRALRVVAVPVRVEPVPHLEAARHGLLAAVLEGYRRLAGAEATRALAPRLLQPASQRAGPADGAGSQSTRRPAGRPLGSPAGTPAAAPPPASPGRAAGLVVLPALAGLLPLGALAGEPPRWDGRLAALAQRYGEAAAEAWFDWSAHAARTLGIYLCPGTVVLPRDDGFEHVAVCFGPDGRLLARQAQLHSGPADATVGLVPGDDWASFPVAGWTATLVVGRDGWIPEVGRWASLEGVRLVIHPGHAPAPASRWELVAGPWQVVQQTQVYWVHAAAGGAVGGRALAPQGAVFAPCEITPEGRGWLAWDDTGEAVAALLEADPLEAIRQRYPLDRYLNPGLYLRYLLPAYRRLAEQQVPAAMADAEPPGPGAAPGMPPTDRERGEGSGAESGAGDNHRPAGRGTRRRRRRRARKAAAGSAPVSAAVEAARDGGADPTGARPAPVAVGPQGPDRATRSGATAGPAPAAAAAWAASTGAEGAAQDEPAPASAAEPDPTRRRRRRRRRRRGRGNQDGHASGAPPGPGGA